MKTPMDLPTLQKEYDAMLKVAKRSLDNNVDLSPAFERRSGYGVLYLAKSEYFVKMYDTGLTTIRTVDIVSTQHYTHSTSV